MKDNEMRSYLFVFVAVTTLVSVGCGERSRGVEVKFSDASPVYVGVHSYSRVVVNGIELPEYWTEVSGSRQQLDNGGTTLQMVARGNKDLAFVLAYPPEAPESVVTQAINDFTTRHKKLLVDDGWKAKSDVSDNTNMFVRDVDGITAYKAASVLVEGVKGPRLKGPVLCVVVMTEGTDEPTAESRLLGRASEFDTAYMRSLERR